ncbi:transposase [Sorangium sp. So ce590]|uniref:transposase n=1 Tax=Sorangium sp. So ce590 TaxID=3133317 RepID=UPI003F63D552
MDEAKRFHHAHQLASYLGLVPASPCAGDREGLETLCRYGARPPFSLERLALLPDDRIAARLRRPRRNGATHLVLDVRPRRCPRHRFEANAPGRAAPTDPRCPDNRRVGGRRRIRRPGLQGAGSFLRELA